MYIHWGIIVSSVTVLYGCTCAQTLYYCYHYPKDKMVTKVLVFVLWVLDTAKSISEAQQMWFYFVHRHAQIIAIIKMDNVSLGVEQISESNPGFSQVVSKKRHSYVFIAISVGNIYTLAGPQLKPVEDSGSSCYCCNKQLFTETSILDIVHHEHSASATELAVNIVVDIFTTTALCCALREQYTQYQRTNNVITRMVTYLMSHGIVLCIIQVITASIDLGIDVPHKTYISEIFRAILGTVYVNSLLVLLNMRAHIIEKTARTINEPEHLELGLKPGCSVSTESC
ncbi:uncharacterized protein C8Q71DRAFT_846343 [Rhodofomes roseus]|uniref:DUF6534 domain-containing protein n=1 Tax=Rhodofomes roseus TaxID=34475 RepID=A0ABQ8KMS2_9APHY|nr:uncharacterized protein C8Q71DRAFT_846343 [Rhodofomes roseus]KAH9839717.1 hypothetical protein C8Q71DRAFT_846343 [Rhodofomes roseus]